VDALDMLQVLSLGAAQGRSIKLEATGAEAEAVLDSLVRLFAAGFHEDEAEGE
jgi:phosphotransferase system HPr-like phosphotransfer protein